MRLRNLILCLLFCIASASAKDVITKTDGTKLDAKVEEITETVIKYRKASNPTGPIYTIALESVESILFDNGEIENFNKGIEKSQIESNSNHILSDEQLLMLAASQIEQDTKSSMSDRQLVNMSLDKSMDIIDLESKVETYNRMAWIGGASWIAVGIIAGAILSTSTDLSWYWGLTLPVGIGVGGIWYAIFKLKSNSFKKQVRLLQSYSTTIIENEILKFGDNSLTAGINVMGNRMVNSHSLGLSLGLNF